jgi:prepilin-type N-terminal cleavage/methylation domain-containing protein
MQDRNLPRSADSRSRQDGFTLIEAIITTLILVVGLVAVSNLMFVSISSNAIANRSTSSTFLASQKMEELRSIAFDDAQMADSDPTALENDTPGHFEDIDVDGGGRYKVRWRVQTVAAYGTSLKFIAVRSEGVGAMGRLTRAELTTFRACTLQGCTP